MEPLLDASGDWGNVSRELDRYAALQWSRCSMAAVTARLNSGDIF